MNDFEASLQRESNRVDAAQQRFLEEKHALELARAEAVSAYATAI